MKNTFALLSLVASLAYGRGGPGNNVAYNSMSIYESADCKASGWDTYKIVTQTSGYSQP